MKEISESEIVFAGEIAGVGQSSFQRMETLRRLGARVRPVDITLPPVEQSLVGRVLPRVLNLPATPRTVAQIDQKMAALADEPSPDIAWFEWPRIVSRGVLKKLRVAWPKTLFVCFQDDNPFGSRRGHQCLWHRFIANIPFYDLHFVKRTGDLASFRKAGAQRAAIFVTGYYEPVFEFTAPPSPRQDVLFVGAALDHRVQFLGKLILDRSLSIHIHGGRWNGSRIPQSYLGPPIFGNAYAEAIRSHKISLGFVSSSNYDEYTMRSLEIPAAGGFLLAERTPFHQKLFREGVEAEFFSGVGECADKIQFYLLHDEERRKIAENGALRCRQSGYGLAPRMREAWKHLSETHA